MKFFEAVPSELFSPLASPNRILYADALDVLYAAYQENLKIREDVLYSMLRGRLERELLHGGQPDDEEPERAPAMFRDRYDTGYRDGYDDAVESLQFANLPQRPRKGKHKRKAAAGNMVRAEWPERPIVMEHQHGA